MVVVDARKDLADGYRKIIEMCKMCVLASDKESIGKKMLEK